MRICYITDSHIPAARAHAVQILQVCSAFAELGHEVTLLAPWHAQRVRSRAGYRQLREDFALSESFPIKYLPRVSLGSRLKGSYFHISSWVAHLGSHDLIYTRNARIAYAATRLGCRVILESHCPPAGTRARSAVQGLTRAQRLSGWVFISDELRKIYAQLGPQPAARTLVAHDGVDLQRFQTRRSKAEARQAAGLSLSPGCSFGYCGSLYKGRGVELLLDIAKRRPGDDVLIIGGDAQQVRQLKDAACKAALDNVVLTGRRSVAELPLLLQCADVLVMPHQADATVSDGVTQTAQFASPMKLFEYMASERPLIATRFPSIEEVLRHEHNALLVNEDGVRALLGAAARLARSESLRHKLAVQALEDVRQYEWKQRCARILSSFT